MGKVVDFVVACTCIIIIILDYIQIIYYYIKKIIQHLDLRYLIWISDFSTWFFLPTTEFQVHLFLRFESEVWHGTAGLHPTEEGAPGPRTEVSRSSYHLCLYRHHCYNNNRLTFEIHLILYSIPVLDFSAVCFIMIFIFNAENRSFQKMLFLLRSRSFARKIPIIDKSISI